MSPWLTEVLKLLGLMTPFIYAAATYGLFHWLDKKASGPAKRALVESIQSLPQTTSVANFILEIFDRIYTRPLLHWRAFLRSCLITGVVCALVWYELDTLSMLRYSFSFSLSRDSLIAYKHMFWHLASNILADYISLFFVRACLVRVSQRPLAGMVVAAFVGIVIVYLSVILRASLSFVIDQDMIWNLPWMLSLGGIYIYSLLAGELIAPALLVHAWFPLFALATLATRALVMMSKAVVWLQWFLKQGQHHPFQAVGYVAGLIVFVVSVAIQIVVR